MKKKIISVKGGVFLFFQVWGKCENSANFTTDRRTKSDQLLDKKGSW